MQNGYALSCFTNGKLVIFSAYDRGLHIKTHTNNKMESTIIKFSKLYNDFIRFIEDQGISTELASIFLAYVGTLPILLSGSENFEEDKDWFCIFTLSENLGNPTNRKNIMLPFHITGISDITTRQTIAEHIEFLGVYVLKAFIDNLSTVHEFNDIFPDTKFTMEYIPEYMRDSIEQTLNKFNLQQGNIELSEMDIAIIMFLGFPDDMLNTDMIVLGDSYIAQNNYNSIKCGHLDYSHIIKYVCKSGSTSIMQRILASIWFIFGFSPYKLL